MGILINKTYDTVTEESAAEGDFAESGFEYEDAEYTFRELVDELKNYIEFSGSWVSTEAEIDYRTGEYTTYSLHFSHNNPEYKQKYWIKALKAAGFID